MKIRPLFFLLLLLLLGLGVYFHFKSPQNLASSPAPTGQSDISNTSVPATAGGGTSPEKPGFDSTHLPAPGNLTPSASISAAPVQSSAVSREAITGPEKTRQGGTANTWPVPVVPEPARAAPVVDSTPRLYAATQPGQNLPDDFLDQTAATLEKEDTSLKKNEILMEKIIDPEEKKQVVEWQEKEIQRREEIKEKNFAEYATSLDNKVIGSWKMGKTATVTFFKDGTGETHSLKEENKEETLLGNFYFRYTLSNNILKVIPILTEGSKRRITCHFVVRRTDQELVIGPYHYRQD